MDNDKTVSVIVPVYKTEKYLEKCLDSIISQTYKNLEIILIDDGSPDRCGEICDSYGKIDGRIKVIHKENGGLCSARNAGLREATGEYIGFVDSDDYVDTDMYEYLVRSLEKYGADIVSCRYHRIGRKTGDYTEHGIQDVVMNSREAVKELICGFTLRSTFWNKLFKRDALSGFTFPEGVTFEGTVTMHGIFERVDKIVMLREPKYYYYDNSESIVNTKNIKNGLDYCLSHIKRYNDLIENYPELREKMLFDVIKTVRVLRYVFLGAGVSEIESSREKLTKIRDFINAHRELIFGKLLPDVFSKKEMKSLLLLSERGFKAAHFYGGLSLRIEKIRLVLASPGENDAENSDMPSPEMTPERKEKLQRLQKTLCEMLGVIDGICRENGLRYFLCGGTLLGAERNGGMIPWDDDIDILMLREDFEKFRDICRKELPPGYFYQNGLTDPEYSGIAAKIRMDGTFFPERRWDKRNFHKGIFIDIFPLDPYPSGKLTGKAVSKAISFIQQVLALDRCYSKNVFVRILFYLAKKKSGKYWYMKREKLFGLIKRHESPDKLCSFGSHYKNKRVLEKEWFSSFTDVDFENEKRMAPNGKRAYLEYLFGEDYITPPPPEKRVCHSELDFIDFGNSEK